MITSDQIENWIREIELRPASAGVILRSIAARLVELDRWNNELLTDNIELRSGSKVEEFEKRIAALSYQLEMIQRNGISPGQDAPAKADLASLLLFNPAGWVLRLGLPTDLPAPDGVLARFDRSIDPSAAPPGMVFAAPGEELLFVFDSGRTVTLPLSQVRFANAPLEWSTAHRVEPRPGEELAAILPISRLAIHEFCIQISRRGCAKLMPKPSFQSLLARGSIGAGVKRRPDKTAALALATREGMITLATHEGLLLTLPAARLPFTVDEVILLSATDHIVSAFIAAGKRELIVVTTGGKALHREMSWLEPASSFKSRGQAIYSPARREAGVRVAGAAALNRDDFAAALRADGSVILSAAEKLIASGTLEGGDPASNVIAFSALGIRKAP